MANGIIIVLNGTSSAGKSSIARALQDAFEDPYLHLLVEESLPRLPERYLTGANPAGIDLVRLDDGGCYVVCGPVGERVIDGFYASVGAYARAGNNVIVDALMGDAFDVGCFRRHLDGLSVLMAGVHCPLALLEERERSRGNRLQGLARGELTRVHSFVTYDVEVDTSVLSPEECAAAIRRRLEAGPGTAFTALAHSMPDTTTERS